ncbi:helix-turn-helix domain-containing protein [Rhodococcus indonesiensis]|uniref:helix-turn-helix domain-containing protein n=1 Tax=Rhodococcus indonesiensis TaxID=3055869 RepID=UPI0039F73749
MARRTTRTPFTTSSHYVSIADAAERLGVSTDTIRRLISSGELAAYRVRNAIRLKTEDVDATLRRVN